MCHTCHTCHTTKKLSECNRLRIILGELLQPLGEFRQLCRVMSMAALEAVTSKHLGV